MRVRYGSLLSRLSPSSNLPWLPIGLENNGQQVQAQGLVDSGSTVCVMPYETGVQLGFVWDDTLADVPLGGIAGGLVGIP